MGRDPGSWEPTPTEPPPQLAPLLAEERPADWVNPQGKNWMGWWSLGLAFNFFPIALILAHAALRAARRGEATNGAVAKAVLVYWYAGMAVVVPLIAMMFWIQSQGA